jgi:hypothetical protein
MPRILLRPKQVLIRLACGKTKFEEDYRFHTPDDPCVPNTDIPRLKPIFLGERNIAFLEHELDKLIDGLAALRDPVGAPRDADTDDRLTPDEADDAEARHPDYGAVTR